MDIKEIQTGDGTKWQCVEALEGMNGNLAQKAEQVNGESENVVVVCTPSGGAQTVRVQLPKSWKESMTDNELAEAIDNNRQ
jgi:hypothetical protein